MKRNYGFIVALLVAGSMFSVQAKEHVKYTQVMSESKFNSTLKDNEHVVVWFYYYAKKGNKAQMEQNMTTAHYEDMSALYNKVAHVEQYKDKNIKFIAVNVSTKEGENIFDKNSVLDDGTLVELPAILLFRNGKMIDNQMSGAMTETRVKSFIERYFK